MATSKKEGGDDADERSFVYKGVPEDDAWFISKLFYTWERPLFQRAFQLHKRDEALEHEDLLPLPAMDNGDIIGSNFEKAWKELEEKMGPSNKTLKDINDKEMGTKRLQSALLKVMGRRYISAGLIKALNTGLQFCFPLLLNAILKFIEETQRGIYDGSDAWYDQYRGYWLSACLFVAMAGKAVSENAYFHRVYRAAYQARTAVSVAVYNKSLRLTNSERQSTTLGELVNLMQVDATKIEMFIPQLHVLWDGMFQIVGYMAILYTLIGWPCFAGLVIMILAGPVQAIIMGKLFGLTRKMVKFTDARVESTNEALQGIQCVKMYTWEEKFAEIISKQREEELKHLKDAAYLRGFARAYMGALPGIVAVTSLVVYAVAYTGADISASNLFAAIVAFDQLRFPLLFYPMALAQLTQAKVSGARVEVFLGLKEIGKGEKIGNGTYTRDESAESSIVIKDAEVYWNDPSVPLDTLDDTLSGDSTRRDSTTKSISSDTKSDKSEKTTSKTETSDLEVGSNASAELTYPKAILKNINLTVKTGELCAVVGRVASGKSTLCSAILNETILKEGEIELHGKVAYAAQSPWILNATLRENILFGLPMDEEKYHRVLKACQLSHDLKLMEDGDLTDIGERGINLSGGQKARVSIARAAYSDADTVILDDPLSALDPEVGKQLFTECIFELMEGKTRLFITNQIQFLSSCDTVVALKRGEIMEQGKFEDLIANKGSEVNRLMMTSNASRKSLKDEDSKNKRAAEIAADAKNGPQKLATKKDKNLLTKEERNIGAVSMSVYLQYLKAGGGFFKFAIVYFGFIMTSANQIATTSWVSYWTSDSSYERHSEAFYLGMYFMFAVSMGLFTFFRAYLLASFGVRASEVMHKNLLNSILHAPQSFFDTTPLGRIISRFSKDIYSIDSELNMNFDFFLFCSLSVLTSLATILYVTPWFGIAVLPLGFLYFRILNYFREVARETKRLDSISRSPVYAHFSETLGGLATIRAYGQPMRFKDEFEEKVDANTKTYYNNKAADRWLSVRLELIGAGIAGCAAVFASRVAISGSSDNANFSSLAGLSLTFAISMTGLLQWCVRSFAQLEAGMNSCERILYYTENIPQEAPFTSKELEESTKKGDWPPPPTKAAQYAVVATGGKPEALSSNWPQEGRIVLDNVKMRYRSDTPLVLRGLNVTISPGERVGVVGRTGSGKSSLLLTLLRLVEPDLSDHKDQDKESYKAPISIDGVDTLRIGLRELRSRIGIIPQNPVLFSGTIRSNIDPFNEFSDEDIWKALEKCGLKDSVEAMPLLLEAPVSEYGGNLSSGTRQMLVLGRALLKQCRILLLDEATSSVDFETDSEIQRTLREAFSDCTILTIAHRINTIMDSDKILVMKDGLAAEFAPPQELLKDEASLFSEIVKHAEDESE